MPFAWRSVLISWIVLIVGGHAFAADIPIKMSGVPAPPAEHWSGCYIGGTAGAAAGADQLTLYPAGSLLTLVAQADRAANSHLYSPHALGAALGAEGGCNWQSGGWVFGGEADLSWSGLRESDFNRYDFIPFVTTLGPRWDAHDERVWTRLQWFSTARARLGYGWNGVLIYVTGGLAIANLNARFSYLDTVLGFEFAGTQSRTRAAPTAGGGVEWRLAPRWTMKAEYLFMDFGSFGFDASPNSPGATFRWGMDVKAHEHIARLGFNFDL